ncbi:transposase [Dehalococcoidia bacterium]|nr:transposase [Dehalococcoidia bacterium]
MGSSLSWITLRAIRGGDKGSSRDKLVFLPPYSPDLNPIEYIWKEHQKDHFNSVHIRHIDDMRN